MATSKSSSQRSATARAADSPQGRLVAIHVGDVVVAARVIGEDRAQRGGSAVEGEEQVARDGELDFGDVADGIEAMAKTMVRVLSKVAPDRWSIEFNVGVAAKAGKLTALFFEPNVKGSVKVVLAWGHEADGKGRKAESLGDDDDDVR